MSDSKPGGEKQLLFSKSQKQILVLCLVAAVICQTLFLTRVYDSRKASQVDSAKVYGESVVSGIKLAMNECFGVSEIIKDIYIDHSDSDFEYFLDRNAERLMGRNDIVSSLYFAPEGVIRYAWPEKVKKATIGFRMLEDSEQGPKARQALDEKRTVVAGPHALIEKDPETGFIVRNPLFIKDKFIGFGIVILDWNKFVNKLLEQVGSANSTYYFAVWKDADPHIVLNEYGYLFSHCDRKISTDIINIPFEVPGDTWHLSAEPEKGWLSLIDIIPESLFSVILVILIMTIIVFSMIHHSKRLQFLEHDELTGLYTRHAFVRYAERLLKNSSKDYDLIVADVENFKLVNNIYGIGKGDEILKYLAKVYKTMNFGGLSTRFGGDSFATLFPSQKVETTEIFAGVARKIQENAPIKGLIVKYGLYQNVEHDIPVNLLLDRAHLAAKSIKHNYLKVIENYDGPLSSRIYDERVLETAFEDALKNEEFKVWFQPKFDAKTEKLAGAEALVRWIKPDGTIISPANFISTFENDGLIIRLDEYMFRKVCKAQKSFGEKGFEPFPISVNLSRTSLFSDGLIERYKKIIQEEGIEPEYVPLELTESAASSHAQLKELSEKLIEAGFKIHMDDFGTGFSSLENLNILPFDVVKLDKSLIDFIGDPGGNELLRHIIELAHYKKLYIVAEGVENKDQLEFLRHLNCNAIQGYYFSAPKSYEKFIDYLGELKAAGRI